MPGTANSFFEQLFSIANASESADSGVLKSLKKLKHQMLSEDKESIRKAARDFTLEEAVQDFGLQYSSILPASQAYEWKIQTFPEVNTFEPSACLESLLANYTAVYDRSSEAGCRVAIDFLLCECIAVMRGKASCISPTQSTGDGRRTPTPWDNVEVHCEVSFTHTVPTTPETIVSGRVDHGVGIVIRSNSNKFPKRLFHSLLLCHSAKFDGAFGSTVDQLVVCLACLRQSRANRGRSNTSVYGVRTDGLSFIFVTITHEGLLKKSRVLNILHGDLSIVLGCLRHILEMAMTMSPNLTPEKLKKSYDSELEADGDDLIDLDDNDDDDDEP